ncbi:MAG: mannosyltransferase [Parcubacteria group bacterium Gr01-1014_38]|nr:MAG: mannosyltransferase [Parcubacteria group bacterium Gr01-1014_38]
MKITLITNASATSGVGKPVGMLREALRAAGQDVTILTLDHRMSAIEQNGRIVRIVPRLPGGKPAFWLVAGSLLRTPPEGILHFTNQTLAFLARRAPERSVVTVWDLIELRDPQVLFGGTVARILYRGIRNAAHLLTYSEATARDVRAQYKVPDARLSVIPPSGSESLRFQGALWQTEEGKRFLADADLCDHPPLVLYVGSEHRRKNLRRLLEALALVRQRVPNVRFVKIGDAGVASGRRELRETIARLHLDRTVRLVEESNDAALRLWYHAATVLAFPSLDEGFGFPPLEAMACGTPVVTSNRSSLPEVVGDAAILVNPEDTEAIAEGLALVLTDAPLRAELRRRGLARAAQFTRENMLAATLAVYAKVLSPRSG